MYAEVYFHGSLGDANRDGRYGDYTTSTFTIAAIGESTPAEGWDLFVSNLYKGVVKFGAPQMPAQHPPFEVDLRRLEKRWLTISIERLDGQCSLNIKREGGTDINLPDPKARYITAEGRAHARKRNNGSELQSKKVPCRMNTAENQIRVNSRASNYNSKIPLKNDHAHVTVRKVSFKAY